MIWISDPHLEFLEDSDIAAFCRTVDTRSGDSVLITGDISIAPQLARSLEILATSIRKTIYFVLGNHDRYGGSFQTVEELVAKSVRPFANLVRLTGKEIIRLSNQTALIGIDGWACATAGKGRETTIRLSDDTQIEDFRRLPNQDNRFALMLRLAQNYAALLRPTLSTALVEYEEVILATHVPPFVGATWHEGKVSGPDFLPLFSSPTMGKMIEENAVAHLGKSIHVYCGHTHSSGFYQTANIKVWTAGARYNHPEIQGTIQTKITA